MYNLALILHSWLRWFALISGFVATAMALRSPIGREAPVDRWGLIFMATLDLQMLIGLLLYFVWSPITAAIFNDFGAAMRDPGARFWAVEHITLMIFAVAIAHVGRVLARKASSPAAKRSRLVSCFSAALIAMLIVTPWPGLPNGRPLFRV